MSVHCSFGASASIQVDDQHLSRLTHGEVREIVCQCLMFGGKKLREEVKGWLANEEVDKVAAVIAPEKT